MPSGGRRRRVEDRESRSGGRWSVSALVVVDGRFPDVEAALHATTEPSRKALVTADDDNYFD